MLLPRLLAACMLTTACFTLSGCLFDKREPVPQHTITVTPELNRYLYDGQPMALDQLEGELKLLADKTRRETTSNARAYVKIISQPGAEWDRTVELVDYCAGIGLDKIETTGR